MEIKSLWHIAQDRSEIRTVADKPVAESVLIKSICSLISTGTEGIVANGQVPKHLFHSMSVPGMQGKYPFPVTHGYSLVGRVIQDLPGFQNKTVHLLHPHQDFARVLPETLFAVPTAMDPVVATLASNMETVVNAMWDSGVSSGERVLITGFGTIGALLALTLRCTMPLVTCYVLEKDGDRRKAGINLGLNMLEDTTDIHHDFDIAIDASGNENALQTCIDKTGYEGSIVVLSWFGNQSVSLNLGGDFHPMRKKIISSQVSQIPVHKKGQWDFARRKELVFKILQDPMWESLPFTYVPFEETPAFFDALRKGEVKNIFNIIKYT